MNNLMIHGTLLINFGMIMNYKIYKKLLLWETVKSRYLIEFFLFQTRVTYAPSNELALCKVSVAKWHSIGARSPKILGSNLKYHFS